MNKVRLHKWIASTGLMSRRKAELAIQEGRVRVNGETVTEMGVSIDSSLDQVTVDGNAVKESVTGSVVLALYKPKNVMTTRSDPEGRRTIMSFLAEQYQQFYPVGRLDFASEGLILVTNDGEFANRVAHPSQGVSKTYEVRLAVAVNEASVNSLCLGIELRDGVGRFRSLEFPDESNRRVCRVVVEEGRNRFVRRMFEARLNEVLVLKRIAIGNYHLPAGLKPGQMVVLTSEEISQIFQ